jgi:hypothetical protein
MQVQLTNDPSEGCNMPTTGASPESTMTLESFTYTLAMYVVNWYRTIQVPSEEGICSRMGPSMKAESTLIIHTYNKRLLLILAG